MPAAHQAAAASALGGQPETSRAAKSAGMWGNLRSVVPRWRQAERAGGDRDRTVPAAAAAAALLDRPAAPSDEGRQHGSGSSTPTAAGGAVPARPAGPAAPDFGYSRGLERKYRVLRELGRGGNGVVRVVEELATGAEWALKSIPKVLDDPKLSDT